MTDIKLPVRNFLIIKRLEDDPDVDGGVKLVGSFVQYVLNEKDVEQIYEENKNSKYFEYRFNDFTYSDALQFRRTTTKDVKTHDDETQLMWRTTFQARIPMRIEVVEELFPFKIMRAKVDIELSSGSNGRQTIRPNLVLAKGGENRSNFRSNVAIHEVEKKKNKSTHHAVDKALDDMAKYDLLSPFPEIAFEYDRNKGYCPKYSVTFYLFVGGIAKFVGTLIPLILVGTLNTLHLLNDMKHSDEGNDSYDEVKVSELLNFSSALALTVIFLFGTIYDPVGSNSYTSITDSLYVIFIFFSLILSAIPESFVSVKFAVRITGATLFWLSFVFPMFNVVKIYWIYNQKKPKEGVEELFLKDKYYVTHDNFSEDSFIRLDQIDENNQDLKEETKKEIENTYELTEKDNTYIISYEPIEPSSSSCKPSSSSYKPIEQS